MMASNILSRFLPPNGSPSVYETIRQHDAGSDLDVEERGGLEFEDGARQQYTDHELEEAMAEAERDDMPNESDAFLTQRSPQRTPHEGPSKAGSRRRKPSRPRWMRGVSPRHDPDDGDDDVPASLLVEGHDDDDLKSRLPPPPSPHHLHVPEPLEGGPSSRDDRVHWESARERLPIHDDRRRRRPGVIWSQGLPNMATVDPKEKALWMWANVENLDNFLKDVYSYFTGNGIWSILLNRFLNLLTFAFIVGFGVFLTNCIDYRNFRGSRRLDDILIQKCTNKMSMSSTFLLWLLTLFWFGKAFQYLFDLRRLKHMHDFFHYLLGITDAEIQTISWQEVVSRLMTLRDSNPATAGTVSAKHRKYIGSQSKQRMDAHDIANRLMRKENYLIALINKDILDLTLPIPFFRNRPLFSRTLEWNLNLCVMDYVFDEQGQVRTLFLKDTHRKALGEGLRRRFIFAGIMNVFVAPFIIVYFMIHYFFRYFNEYKKNPSRIGSRQYTALAEWKFREFNELWHLFDRRINMSYPFANRYLDQFPKDKTIQAAGFVAFVAGALASVLALASLVDPELFLGFEITPDRTVLFYLGIFGSVWAVANGLVPEETNVFDPEFALSEVIDFTHYCPSHWKGRLHSDDVRKEFAALFQMKIVSFAEEILSLIFTPFILWFSLPKSSDRLIDFFREFTVHVDGMGYLCSFAVFDFKKGTNVIPQGPPGVRGGPDLRGDYYSTKDGKMLASYYGFLDNYGANHRGGHPATRRQFHPPPAFPTLGTPSMADMGHWGERPDPVRMRHTPPGGAQSYLGPRGGPPGLGDHASPAPSVLLDPHHQPSASGFRSSHRPGVYSRYRPARGAPTVTSPIEDDDEPPSGARGSGGSPHHGAGSSGGGVGASGSNLGESWRMNLMGDDTHEGDEGEEVDAITGGAGVLGLIQQFQKVNKDHRGRTTVGL